MDKPNDFLIDSKGNWNLQDSSSHRFTVHTYPKVVLGHPKCSHSNPGNSTAKELALATKKADRG